MKTCLILLFPFYNKMGQYVRKEKKVACTNSKCEQEVNDVCCDGKLKVISSRFHYRRGIASNAMLDRYDVCEKNVKVSLINGILSKCTSCDSVLVKCDCDVLNVGLLPEDSKKLKCKNSMCKIQTINCKCGKVANQDFKTNFLKLRMRYKIS